MLSSKIEQVEQDLKQTHNELKFQERIILTELEYQLKLINRREKTLNKFKSRQTICKYTGLTYINSINNYINGKIERKTTQLLNEMDAYQRLQLNLVDLLRVRKLWYSKKSELNEIKRAFIKCKYTDKVYV